MVSDFGSLEIPRRLLLWYGREGRDLPWRHTRDPYRIWLSEIMLQQTGVSTVIPYYRKFLENFPTVGDLAKAPVEEVIAAWAGLGYYTRARNLHAAAQKVVRDFGGLFPADLEKLKALPGVGRSTAGAILSIAFDRKGPILDGNVRRVLVRLFALQEDPRSPAAERKLWGWAEALTPEDHPHDYAQAIMDLGATVCTPTRPDCGRCPLADFCQAKKRGMAETLPLRRTRKAVPSVTQIALILSKDGRCLVRRRPLEGLLGGLWEFPVREVIPGEEAGAVASLLHELGMAAELKAIGRIRHAYSHFRLDLHLFRGEVDESGRVSEEGESRWLSLEELGDWPLHGAHRKALKHL